MSMDKQTTAKVANLARIGMDEAEIEQYAESLSNILQMVEQLSEVDTDNVEPLASVTEMDAVWRVDDVSDGDVQKEVLANAPENTEGYFVVPKVVE